MEKTKKVTKRERFNQLLKIEAVKNNPDLVAFIEHEKELLTRKNTTSNGEKKLTPTQVVNEKIKAEIIEIIKNNGSPMTITEIWKILTTTTHKGEELTNQRISALVRQLKEDSIVERTENKRKAYFGIPTEVEGE